MLIRAKSWDWELFDAAFPSGDVGFRKPELKFYNHVLEKIGHVHTPDRVVFVDDKIENVLAARSLGIRSIQFQDRHETTRQLQNMLENPISRGEAYLLKHAQNLASLTDSGDTIRENFAQVLIYEATGNR
jgi:FMN phosphatase YigB (HAD superfamily)